jgi:hypothetical protein
MSGSRRPLHVFGSGWLLRRPRRPRSASAGRSLKEAGLRGHSATSITGIDRIPRLDQQDLGLVRGVGAMLDSAWDDEDLAGAKLDVAVAQVDRQTAADDQKEVVGLVVLVPDERALTLTT